MNRFQKTLFSTTIFFILLAFSGCYTTFQSVRYGAAGVNNGYYSHENSYYSDENTLIHEGYTTLNYTPDRWVVRATYFDYGGYVRTERYIYDARWCDPFPATYYNEPRYSVNFHFGWQYPPGRPPYKWYGHDWWFTIAYLPYYPVAWTPGWWDPWWHDIVYVPVIIYPPPPIIVEPIYDPPYDDGSSPSSGHGPGPTDGKRDWDRRQPSDRGKIVRRSGRNDDRVDRRPSPDRRRTVTRPGPATTGRSIETSRTAQRHIDSNQRSRQTERRVERSSTRSRVERHTNRENKRSHLIQSRRLKSLKTPRKNNSPTPVRAIPATGNIRRQRSYDRDNDSRSITLNTANNRTDRASHTKTDHDSWLSIISDRYHQQEKQKDSNYRKASNRNSEYFPVLRHRDTRTTSPTSGRRSGNAGARNIHKQSTRVQSGSHDSRQKSSYQSTPSRSSRSVHSKSYRNVSSSVPKKVTTSGSRSSKSNSSSGKKRSVKRSTRRSRR